MKMRGFPASIDMTKIDFLLRVVNRAWLPLFSKTNLKEASHAEAIASIVPSTSAGFPASYNGHYEKRSVLETMSYILALFYCVCEQYNTIFAISLKDELRPREKVEAQKTRAFIISPIEHLYVCARVFGPFVEHFYQTRGTPSAIGVSPFNRQWHYEMSPLLDFSGLCGDSDGSAFDINQRTNVHVLVLKFILQFLDPSLHTKAIWCYREAICGYTITQQGYVFRRSGHNPSGWLLTAVVNTLVMYIMLACSFFDHYGYSDEAIDMWFAYVLPKIFGDDNVYAVSPVIAHEYNPALILKKLSVYAPFEGSTWFKPPTHVVFLQAYSRKIQGIWVPHFLNEKCWSSLYFIHSDLTAVQKLSKYTSLLKIYWFNLEFREYLLRKVRSFVSEHHAVCSGDASWDALVLEAFRDFTPVYRNPQCRVILNPSPIKDFSLPMSASVTSFDKLSKQVTKDATKQIRKKEKSSQPAEEKQLKKLLKRVYGRGLHSSLKTHSHYYRSLVDPFNTPGAKVPNAFGFVPSGTVQTFYRTTASAVGPSNRFGVWVRPSVYEAVRTLGYAGVAYGWSAAAAFPGISTSLNGLVNSYKPVSCGLAIQFLGNFNSNDGEYAFALIPAKSGSGIAPSFNFMAPVTTDAGYDSVTQTPYFRTLPINNGGGFITWRPTDFDSIVYQPFTSSPAITISGTTYDPLGSILIMGDGAANQTLKFRITVVVNYEVLPNNNATNLFNMSPSIKDSMEMDMVARQMSTGVVPVSTNTKAISGVMNSSENTYTTHHDTEEGLSTKMMKTLMPLMEGIQNVAAE